ncbi:MAG: NADH-quinone oxidoreductase subunit C [Planctomycetota bacterium]|jgi:NADH-quinone oxidoreductase subunit C
MSDAEAEAPEEQQPQLPETHGDYEKISRVLEENQVDHELLKSKLGGFVDSIDTLFKQTVMRTSRDKIIDVLKILKNDPELHFWMLTDITAVDNMRRKDFDPERRFTMIYIVYSLTHKKRVRIEVDLPEQDPSVDCAGVVYKGAPWAEREVFDMFGIIFNNHPKLERVLTPDYFEHHPLRKDYPLTGRGERDNFVHADELQ